MIGGADNFKALKDARVTQLFSVSGIAEMAPRFAVAAPVEPDGSLVDRPCCAHPHR